jgi:hypothetical protein
LPGELSQTSRVSSGHAAGRPRASGVAPTSRAPTSYVGYAARGCTTTSPAPRSSRSGRRATSSFEPIVGSTFCGVSPGHPAPTVVPVRRSPLAVPGFPTVWGYACASVATRERYGDDGAAWGPPGEPIDRSTIPSGWARARAAYGATASQG